MFADGVQERREEQVARMVRTGKKSGKNVFRARAFPLLAGETRAIKKGAIRHAAVQQTFFVKPVQSGHDRGVSQRATQLADNLPHAAFSARPEKLHQLEFERAERQRLALRGIARDAILEEANHYWLFIEPMPETE